MNKEQALSKIGRNHELAQAFRLERVQVEQIIDLALMYEDGDFRWEAYETLKEKVEQVVGWEASRPELRTSSHYEAFIDFLDGLLPAVRPEHEPRIRGQVVSGLGYALPELSSRRTEQNDDEL